MVVANSSKAGRHKDSKHLEDLEMSANQSTRTHRNRKRFFISIFMPQKAIQITDHTSTQLDSTQLSSALFSLNLAVGTFPYLRKVLNFDREKRNTLKNQSSVDKTKAFRLRGMMWVHRRKAFCAVAKHNTPLSETLNHVKFIRKRAARRESSRQVIRGFAESHPRVCLCARLGKQRNHLRVYNRFSEGGNPHAARLAITVRNINVKKPILVRNQETGFAWKRSSDSRVAFSCLASAGKQNFGLWSVILTCD